MSVKYKIFEVSDDGLLKHPTHRVYGLEEKMFNAYSGYESVEDAHKEIQMFGGWGEFLILPVYEKDKP